MPMKPKYVEIAVTNRCNARCKTCNIWRLGHGIDSPELDLSRPLLLETLSDPLFGNLVELVLTGGEPFLRADLAEIVGGVAALKKTNLTKLRTIIVPTNGVLSSKIGDVTATAVDMLAHADLQLVIDVSLNALSDNHDTVKGISGAYARVLATLSRLDSLRASHKNLFVGVNIVVSPDTIDDFEGVVQFAKERNLFWLVSPLSISQVRFRNSESMRRLQFSQEQLRRLADFYFRESHGVDYCFEVIGKSYLAGRRLTRCVAGNGFLFIDADGSVYPCPILEQPLGKLGDTSCGAFWSGEVARTARARVGKAKTCLHCLEFGSIRSGAVIEGFGLFRFLISRIIRNRSGQAVVRRIREYGLDKYL
jgi:MoaA/NifB/PqqE/SkfB family radical SAM enzyme